MNALSGFLWNIGLMSVWVSASGNLTIGNFITGFILGFVILLSTYRFTGKSLYPKKVYQIFSFLIFMIVEIMASNIKMARYLISKDIIARPGIIKIHLDIQNDAQIALLAGLITLTPGTITLEIAPDRSSMYIHSMFVNDRYNVEKNIKTRFEHKIMELFE
jgi:multicomponent Na+:H+ antiporter subunit E